MGGTTAVAVASPRAWVVNGRDVAVGVGIALLTIGVAAVDGGYFPTAWGWTTLALVWAAALAILSPGWPGLSRLGAVMLAALAGLGAWTWAALLWSDNPPETVLAGQRVLVYVAGAAALLFTIRAGAVRFALAGALVGISLIAAYSLATRLFPERLGIFDPAVPPAIQYRLGEPLGYWNGLGIFVAMGALLSLGWVARGKTIAGRASAAVAPVVLLPTLYFTFSRGAAIALAAGLLAVVAFDHRRLQLLAVLLVLAVPAGLATWYAYEAEALAERDTPLATATREGHRVAAVVVALALVSAIAVGFFAFLERRVRPSRATRRAFAIALALAAAATLTVVFVRSGGPVSLAERGYDSFVSRELPPKDDLQARLFTFRGSARRDLWDAAWRQYREHPLLGSGPGTFEQHWLRSRDYESNARSPFSVYLETLAELGPVGLGLLAVALAAPLVAAVKVRRRHPLVVVAFGPYVAYLIHAGTDWDWWLPALTLTALVCGAALIGMASTGRTLPRPPRGARAAGVAACITVGAVALVGLVGNTALAASRRANADGEPARAAAEARKAADWAPWSSEPWTRLGEAQLAQGQLGAARRSFRKAITKEPDDWALWFDLASITEGKERRRAVAQALRLNPHAPEIDQLRGPS
jgi:cytochrome c-type biogenesis protein CcmH/NrfG